MINETKFVLKMQRILGGYKITRDEYRNSTMPIESDNLGTFSTEERALMAYNRILHNINTNLFKIKAAYSAGGALSYYHTDFVFRDLEDIALLMKINKQDSE
jgi:hypothetical protein